MNPIRVVVADDDDFFNECLTAMVARGPGLEVVGRARNGREAVDQATSLQADVVLMDVHMPVLDGIAATRELRALMPTVRILVVSNLIHEELRSEAEQAGASAVMAKATDSSAMIGAIRAMAGAS